MVTHIIVMAFGFALGFIIAGVIRWKTKASQNEYILMREMEIGYALLKARVRAIQDNGVVRHRGERTYIIQKPDGKFGKFNLPDLM